MTILQGYQIASRCIIQPHTQKLIHYDNLVRQMTSGESLVGYDVTVEFDAVGLITGQILRPGEFMLASTIEYFNMPTDVVGIVHDKSSWARKGLAVQNTVIEPGWRGYLTLELSNHSPYDISIQRGWPIAQVVFHLVEGGHTPGYYGKYQDQQKGPQDAR